MGGCCSVQEYRILMLGIGAAGKTTILYRLKKNEVVHTIATVGFTLETVHFGDLEFCVWDLGGQDKIRPLWRHYFEGVQGVIFVVDASDRSLFNTAKKEFHQINKDLFLPVDNSKTVTHSKITPSKRIPHSTLFLDFVVVAKTPTNHLFVFSLKRQTLRDPFAENAMHAFQLALNNAATNNAVIARASVQRRKVNK